MAAPIMALMMLLASRRQVMGQFTLSLPLKVVGWSATVVMGSTVLGLIATVLV
jgi:hypothetical protein